MRSSSAPRLLRTFALFAATAAASTLVALGSPTASTQSAPSVGPSVRVLAPVSNSVLTTLKANVHPLAQARFDRGAVPGSMPTGRMMLLLRRSDEQQRALHRYLDDLQNPGSPNYRKWLTPETLGKTYGVSDADLAAVQGWLESEGFRVEKVSAARSVVVFTGTASSVESAFHTSIHSYLVNGEKHYANATDPQVPAALAPVIAGIAPLNDFHAKPQHIQGPRGVYDAEAKRFKPDLTLYPYPSPNQNVPLLFVDPADAATIYNTPNSALNANYSASATRDGSGVTIGIVGYSNLQTADVLNYRTLFLNDADAAHLPTVVIDGTDPGVLSDGTGDEALLDTEVAGGLAPGAAINYYTASTTDLQDGLSLAILRALDDNTVGILSVSYGQCEASLGAAGNYQFSLFWEQAASQGITVTASTGDSGSAGCDDPNAETSATQGLGVSGIASTPYNIAVGGTDFAALVATSASFAQYVSLNQGPQPYYGTALGYIPEVPWNDSVITDATVALNTAYTDSSNNTNIVAGGGGKSSLAYCSVANNSDGSCSGVLVGYPKPAFQTSTTPNDSVRDLPDVSFLAANGADAAIWAFCADNVVNGDTTSTYTDCQTTGGVIGSSTQIESLGGTSASTPAFAGMLALVSQSLGNNVRLGQADNVIYNLAANHYATIFHDVTAGNNSVPCSSGSPSCGANGFLTGYDTATGYDYASGLGSLDVTAMAAGWTSASFAATTTTLGVGTTSGAYSTAPITVQHGTQLYFSVAVSPSTATGDTSVTNTSGVANNQASLFDSANTLGANGTAGLVTYSSQDLPGGTYSISAYYEGDTTHAASTSTPSIAVNISSEPSTTVLTINVQDPASNNPVSQTAMPYGFYAYADAQPYGNHSAVSANGIQPDGVPTGNVMLSVNGTPTAVPLNSIGLAEYPLYATAPGSYTFTAAYGGDASFQASSSGTQSLTITKGATTLTLTATKNTTAAAIAPRRAANQLPLTRAQGLEGGAALCSLLLFCLPGAGKVRRRMTGLLVLLIVAGAAGCGGSSGSSTPTQPTGPTPASGAYTVTALLGTDSFGAAPTGAVTVTVNGATYNAATTQTGSVSNGTVAVQLTFTVPGTAINVGANTVSASYAGDGNYSSSTGTGTVTGS